MKANKNKLTSALLRASSGMEYSVEHSKTKVIKLLLNSWYDFTDSPFICIVY